MLATLVDEPFHRDGWVYEEKYDGYRILAYKEGPKVTLYSRNAKDRTESFSQIARAIAALPDRTLLFDGEAVAFDGKLVSRFQLLQQGDRPYVYAVFDCLYRNGRDLRNEPLPVRREEMEEAIGDTDHLLPSRRLEANGLKAYKTAKRKGWEGLVAKDSSAPYVEGRSTKWLKVKIKQEEEFVIGGYTAPGGSRSHFGSLLLGHFAGGTCTTSAGWARDSRGKTLSVLHRRFQPLVQAKSPFVVPPKIKDATWISPKLVAQVAFQEWTDDQKLRQPVFFGLRDDKKPSEVLLPVRK